MQVGCKGHSLFLTSESDAVVYAEHIASAMKRDPLQGIRLLFIDRKPAEIKKPKVDGRRGSKEKLLPLVVPLPLSLL